MEKELINKTTSEILDKFGRENIESLLLIGSVARGEALPGSDIEFLAVMRQDVFHRIDRRIDKVKGITLGFTTKEHLKRYKPYIFTLETRKFGKIMWGDKHVLTYIPDYSYDVLDPIDGFILLNNRIIEQLILLKKIESRKPVDRYEFDKGYIQLVNSYLAVNRQYKSHYPEKLAEFLGLYKDKDEAFVVRVKEAFESLGSPQQFITSKEEALARWKELRKYFKKMWLYERRLVWWIKLLKKMPRFLIYYVAAKEYFSENLNLDIAKRIIKQWENFVK